MKNNLLAVGWDVGGWMGSNHGFSILHWDYEEKNTAGWENQLSLKSLINQPFLWIIFSKK